MGYALTVISRHLRAMLSDPVRRFQLSLLSLVALMGLGTVVFMLLERMNAVDALYMTVITIATVGFGEVQPLSPAGRMFTIVLIILGVGTATSAISNAVSIVLGPRLWQSIQQRRMEQHIMTIENHYIVCGYGRMGQQIVRDLQARGEAFLVVDADEGREEALLEDKIPYIIGDATRDETLHEAHVERARGLVTALNSDADNVMTVLTGRELNPKLFIVSRVVNSEAESKLRRAGANRVVSPYLIGGHRMALALLRPAVHDFLNRIYNFTEGMDMDIGQIDVRNGSPMAGLTIAATDLRKAHNVNIIAIRRPDGSLTITPNVNDVLEAGATLIVIGPPEAIYTLEREEARS